VRGGGGWRILPNPKDPGVENTYVSALALLALLETRRAGLGWGGSAERRAALLRGTAAWLGRHFDAKADPPGWYKDSAPRDRIPEGLTLQIYALLLRANVEAGVELPDALLDAVPRHLARCADRTLDFPDQGGYVSYQFTPPGRKKPEQLIQNLTYLWYPWA